MERLSFRMPANPAPGDRVAVLSPSFAGPAAFPLPFELGLRRLRDEFHLEPVEYPTTRKLGASAQERADDINQAFGDPGISGVLTSLGGSDQIKVLKHLDRDVIASNLKAFVGYSVTPTSARHAPPRSRARLHYLWRLGIVGYHGASVMVEVGRPGRMHPLTRDSLHRALFTSGEFEVPQVATGRDESRDWADPETFDSEPKLTPVDGWRWHGPARRVLGPSWGGCLEIIDYHLRANRYLGPVDQYDGCLFFCETSEDMPSADYVYEVLMGMGERGLLQRFPAVVVGRPKAWSFATPNTPPEKERYRRDQEQAGLLHERVTGWVTQPEWRWRGDAGLELDGVNRPRVVDGVGGRVRSIQVTVAGGPGAAIEAVLGSKREAPGHSGASLRLRTTSV